MRRTDFDRNFSPHFGKRLKDLRAELQLTQKEFADKLMSHQSKVSRMETGESVLDACDIYLLRRDLEVDLNRLFSFNVESPPTKKRRSKKKAVTVSSHRS